MHRLRHAGCCFLSSSGAARFKVFIRPSHQRACFQYLETNLGIPRGNRQTRSPQHDKFCDGSAALPGLPVGFGDQCRTRHTSRDIFCSGRFCISCCKIPTVPKRSQLFYGSKTSNRETQGASGSQIEGQRWLLAAGHPAAGDAKLLPPGALRLTQSTESGSEDIYDIAVERAKGRHKTASQVIAALDRRDPLRGADSLVDIRGPFGVM